MAAEQTTIAATPARRYPGKMRGAVGLVAMLVGCGGTATGEAGPPAMVYLHVDRIALTKGAEDATTDTSSAIEGTLSPYLAGEADRAGRIAGLTTALEEIVAPFHVDIVTTRPDSPRYDMIVIAGTPEEVGLSAGTGGVSDVDCGNAIPNKIVVVFGNAFPAGFDGNLMASLAVAGLGVSQGLPSSDLGDDCLCWKGQRCDNTKRCTFGGPGTPIASGDPCGHGETTMDPMTEFASRFGLAQ